MNSDTKKIKLWLTEPNAFIKSIRVMTNAVVFPCIVKDGLQCKYVLRNAIESSEETLLDGGVNDAINCEIVFKVSSMDLVKELSHSSSLGNGLLQLGRITSFGEENNVCSTPAGGFWCRELQTNGEKRVPFQVKVRDTIRTLGGGR